jgi:ABC-2 type transport system ATP-binding protein
MGVVIRTEQLTKRYGPFTALDALDLEVVEGEALGYLGPNGAGKSTTLALLLGLIRPTSGRASIYGLDPWGDAPELHRRLAYVPSEANLWPTLTGAETLHFLAEVHGSVDVAYRDELIERFELAPDKKVRAYSHGNRQKVLLIAALASRADLILLDEPTTGLDPLMEQVFRRCVAEARERGQTTVLSSHIMSEVEAVCDRVAMLRNGRIIETGQLSILQSLAGVKVEATLEGTVPDLSSVAGVANVQVDGTTLRCDVAGEMGPLLHVLADAGATRLTTREPSLEELFLAHYGDEAAGAS